MKRFILELSEPPYYFSCKNCKNKPELIFKDKENIEILCKNCNIIMNETIEKIVNYSSIWVTNDFKSNIRFKNKEDLNNFENFLKNAENGKKNKYKKLNEDIVWLENYNTKDKETREKLNDTINNILNIFYNDIKIEQNLIFFAKILFFSYNLEESESNQEIDNKYKTILLSLINNILEKENIELFLKKYEIEKEKFKAFANRLNEEEINELKNNINKIFEPKSQEISDSQKKKEFIQDNIESSSLVKRYTTNEKAIHPENYVDINEEIHNDENMKKDINSNNSYFVLSLLGKCLENNGTLVNVSKVKDEKINKIELASIQSIFTVGTKKKFELHFDFGKEKNEKILNDPKEKNNFIKKYKQEIAKKLDISIENLIFTDIHSGSVAVHTSTVNSNKINAQKMKELEEEIEFITKVEEKPLLEAVQISPEILDHFGDRSDGWGINEMRGGEIYMPPLNGWYGIGLKVWNQYDKGDNSWLDYRNKDGEFAIGYIGLYNFLNDKDSLIKDLNNITKSIKNMIKQQTYENDIDMRNNGFLSRLFSKNKCKEGICVFQNPDYAENCAGIIDLPDLKYKIKIILMCRINPKKIRQPEKYKECWILDPTPEQIRPYRILFKKIPTSALKGAAEDELILESTPQNYIINIIKSNDFSFYDSLKESETFLNGKKLSCEESIMRFYTSEYYIYINKYLRCESISELTIEQLKSCICCLHFALTKNSNVKNDIVVYRGITKKFPQNLGKGSKFYLREFCSTTTDIEKAKGFAGNNGTIMIITIKNNGTNNHLAYCHYIEELTHSPGEKEVLITCHSYFTVLNIERKEKGCDNIYIICEGFVLN